MGGFDYEARVNCPVSGEVWEDVLRKVAVWHLRVDLYAPRMERVCKRWKHYWQVAEGVFDVDVTAKRLGGMKLMPKGTRECDLTMKEVKSFRERARMNQLIGQFAMKGVGREALSRQPSIEEHMAENKRRADAHVARMKQEMDERREAERLELMRLLPTLVREATLEEFVANWPGQQDWRA
jgi:hypothetical protein